MELIVLVIYFPYSHFHVTILDTIYCKYEYIYIYICTNIIDVIMETVEVNGKITRLEGAEKRSSFIDLFHLPTLMNNFLFIDNIYVTLQSSTCLCIKVGK